MLRRIINKLKITFADKNWESKRKYLVQEGAQIGQGTRLNCSVLAFGSEPYLISCGKDCLFAADIHFITHDGGIKVLNSLDKFSGKSMDKIAPIVIGNNVYIGMGAFIMPGVHIGNNSIIGAGAIVTHDIPENVVAVGIPAKPIETIDQYHENTLKKNMLFCFEGYSNAKKREKLRSFYDL